MRFRRRLGFFLIVCTFVCFFVWSVADVRRTSRDRHKDFLQEEYSGEVTAVDRKNRGNHVYLVNGYRTTVSVDFSYKMMRKYRNKRFSDILSSGDSIFKEKGSEIVVIKKKEGKRFELICK